MLPSEMVATFTKFPTTTTSSWFDIRLVPRVANSEANKWWASASLGRSTSTNYFLQVGGVNPLSHPKWEGGKEEDGRVMALWNLFNVVLTPVLGSMWCNGGINYYSGNYSLTERFRPALSTRRRILVIDEVGLETRLSLAVCVPK